MKLLIAALTALGLIGTGAHQAGFFDIESEPTSVVNARFANRSPSEPKVVNIRLVDGKIE
jgi:hypothetical protein